MKFLHMALMVLLELARFINVGAGIGLLFIGPLLHEWKLCLIGFLFLAFGLVIVPILKWLLQLSEPL